MNQRSVVTINSPSFRKSMLGNYVHLDLLVYIGIVFLQLLLPTRVKERWNGKVCQQFQCGTLGLIRQSNSGTAGAVGVVQLCNINFRESGGPYAQGNKLVVAWTSLMTTIIISLQEPS